MKLQKLSEAELDAQGGTFTARGRLPETWDKYNERKGYYRASGTLCVDGEGYSRDDGEHLYTYIAASNPDGKIVHETRYAPEGLSTDECFWFLVTLPRNHRKVGFSFSYDVNMM